MGRVFCPKCRKMTYSVNRIYTPFPKSLRLVRRDAICIYCGVVLSSDGGEYTEYGKIIVLTVLTGTFGVIVVLLKNQNRQMPFTYVLAVMIDALIFCKLGILIYLKVRRKRNSRSRSE